MRILRAYHILYWHSELYHQNQNPAEWGYRTIKAWTNTVMNRSGAPGNCWLLFLVYVCYLLNHIVCTALGGKIPLLACVVQSQTFPSSFIHFPCNLCSMLSEERAAYWVDFGEHCGNGITHKFLDTETLKLIYRSAVRYQQSSTPNHRLAPHGGEVSSSTGSSAAQNTPGSPVVPPESS